MPLCHLLQCRRLQSKIQIPDWALGRGRAHFSRLVLLRNWNQITEKDFEVKISNCLILVCMALALPMVLPTTLEGQGGRHRMSNPIRAAAFQPEHGSCVMVDAHG